MILKYVLPLAIGHLLGDFYFQNEKIAEYKDKKYRGVFFHSLEYYFAVFLAILPLFSTDMFLAATYAALSHFIIDTIKYFLLAKKKIRKGIHVFVSDQCAHIITILLLAHFMDYHNFSIGHIKIINDILNAYGCSTEALARWILALLFIHRPANILIQNFLEHHRPRSTGDKTIIHGDSKAGRQIGTIERLIMLLFLASEQYTAMGFVLTAKSIARYDKISKDEKFAEYYLLGTLASTLCVIVCSKLILN